MQSEKPFAGFDKGGRTMIVTSVSRVEVGVNDTIYMFETPEEADAFLVCLLESDSSQCKVDHPPIDIRPMPKPATL
jgi:hypothetical protein